MGAIKLTAFTGEQPLIQPRLLPDTAAQSAVDVRLNDGALTAMRSPVQTANAGAVDHKTIIKFDGDWLSFANEVHAAPGPVADDRLYYTGDGAPKMRVDDTVYPLALAPPSTALSTATSGSGTGAVQTRIYVYTWVTDFGEESEPSPASGEVDWQSGITVTLSGFEATPTGRNITKQRIYRSQTGDVGTYFYFVAERAASTSDFADNVAIDGFNEPLPSANWNAPPDGLSGLTTLPNGIMAAFVGRDLYFSEPWRPHAWPEKYVLTTDYPIVALGAVGSVLIVMTSGLPYVVQGSHPSSMRMDKIEQNLPCINSRAVVDLGYAIAYPSSDGLVVIAGDGQARLVTVNLFDRDSWQALSPQTAIAGQMFGRYVMFYDTTDSQNKIVAGAIFIEVSGTPFLLRSSARATAVWYDLETSKLYYLGYGTDDILELDPPTGARAIYYWRSKEFAMQAPTNFGVIQVDAANALSPAEVAMIDAEIAAVQAANEALIAAGSLNGEINSHEMNAYALGGDILAPLPKQATGIEVSVFADGNVVKTVNVANKPVRLPSGFKARKWEVSAQGRSSIEQIVIAHTMADLMQVVG
ncbi:hypothetical protein [Labrenzia sp. R5_0]|uniref:hypothetical protein n=1 Tax=Labrenzia sp. R5_0 TaxID=2821108 RepID=UPI001ADA377B|nr:hypothetical protein [Labrenzia sp. R5_0]MBO9458977.1 hypothetical protein [Labrenzia sp. R5_0]